MSRRTAGARLGSAGRFAGRLKVVFGGLCMGLAASGNALVDDGPRPSAAYGPGTAVELQLDALQRAGPGHEMQGLAVLFRFASPRNRRHTGPLPRFVRMVQREFGALLEFEDVVYWPLELRDERAWQRVTLWLPDDRRQDYVFELARQPGGECDGCWLTERVYEPAPAGVPPRPYEGDQGPVVL